jgi:molecular chaperone IbpA
MTYIKDVFGNDIQLFDKFFVGFDEQVKRLQNAHDEITKNVPNYPPYNIKKTGENTYVIEMAVAGFSKSEIEIEIDSDKLHIRGNTNEEEVGQYIYRGLAARPFTRTFMLNDNVEVKNAAFVNGMLKVILEHITPEQNKPKRIEILDDEPTTVSSFVQGNTFKSGEQIFGPDSN